MTAFAKLDQERMNNVSLQRTNACISHEIITPLRTIELMCKKLLPECTSKMSKMIHSILNGAKFMEFSVRNTLKFSRMQHGVKFNLEETIFDPVVAVKEVCNFLSEQAKTKNVKIQTNKIPEMSISSDRTNIQ